MDQKIKKELYGKTIQKIDTRSCNVWRFIFTDGTVYEFSFHHDFLGIDFCTVEEI